MNTFNVSENFQLKGFDIRSPFKDNKLVNVLIDSINKNDEVRALWEVMNVNAQHRMKMTDHGIVHFQVVTNHAVKMARILRTKNIKLSVEKDYGLSYEHGELIIVLGSLLHDLGMSINRSGHEEFSLFLANNIMRETLTFLPIREKTIVISETLHAIYNHRSGGKPLTIEAGIVRIADAIDMEKGRSRFANEMGNIDIYNISHFAIDKVELKIGKNKPILIKITMNNSAGLFQIDELLDSKLAHSGLEKYVEMQAKVTGKTEKKLIREFLVK
ncbi:MAG: HD domain-containing protein [Patescibacteria group bacterium]